MPRVLIVGGGIGGLAAAIALDRAGADVEVFEQADELREIGAGVSLWTNAMKALDALGIGDAVRDITSPLEVIETRDSKGRVLSTLPLAKVHERLGRESAGIHRRELLAALAAAVPRDRIHTGARFERLDQDGHGVTAYFADGRTERGDALVGADGVFSAVRSHCLCSPPPRYGGYVVWRGVVEAPVPAGWPRNASVRTFSRDRHFGIIELTAGRYFWYATRNQPKDEPERGGRKRTLLDQFGHWHAPIQQLLEGTAEEAMLRHHLYAMRPLRTWTRTRVTLLGDAAHPMTPSLGQGACQALEDAVVLGDAFRTMDLLDALRSYERRRRRRATSIVRWSAFFAAQEQLRNPILTAIRDVQTALTPPALGARFFERFLRFDPPV